MHGVDHIDPGDAELSAIDAALAGKGRCKILLALADGRACRPVCSPADYRLGHLIRRATDR